MFKIWIDASERYNKKVELRKIGDSGEAVVEAVSGDIDIVSAIQGLLEEHKLKVTDIEEFTSNPGPGSFTGLKIGATIANVLNWSLKLKKLEELRYPNYGREPNITPRKG